MDLEKISIVKLTASSDIYESIKSGFNLIGKPVLDKNSVVAIKPNLCCIKGPETGATTDPKVVRALIRYLQDDLHVTNISIVESDGTQLLADMAFKLLGYDKISKELNVNLVNLSKAPYAYRAFPENSVLKKVRVPEMLEKTACLISVPKIKNHSLCTFGVTIKNQYGCNPVARKSAYHSRLHDCMVDLTAVFKPNLVVVDGLIGMEGRGPIAGIPVKMNTLIFGRDALAVDHLIARLIGVNPNDVEYMKKAQKRGLGTTKYVVTGASIQEAAHRFNRPPKRSNLYGLFSLRK